MLCPRGFLLTMNMRTGDLRPFFLHVREEDIIWKDQVATRDDIVEVKEEASWLIETHTLLNRAYLNARLAFPTLTYVSTKKVTMSFNLPVALNASKSTITINKESNDIVLIEDSSIEAKLVEADEATGLTKKLVVTLINPDGSFTNGNIQSISGCFVNIMINGFTK